MKILWGFVSGHSFSNAANRRFSTTPLGAGLLTLVLIACISAFSALAQTQSPPPSQPAASEPQKDAAPQPKTFGDELIHEEREVTGANQEKADQEKADQEKEDAEEYANLKHAKPIRWLANQIGWSVHGAHLLLFTLNFAIVAAVVLWAGRKFLPAIFGKRSQAIQQALEEARSASQDANRRLADIENRLRQLDVEIGRMQATAEKEAAAEETRIQQAAEEEMRKVVQAAEHEIATAAKQARRDLSTHTASLAVALARQQINVDSNTDQVLVRSFASTLSHNNDGGKDGQ